LYITSCKEIPERYHGIGVRIEDNIIITNEGNENITKGIVKDPDKIEELMTELD
jgi:Xaa-Pro aminopeptidase